jgi:hypothetical protein
VSHILVGVNAVWDARTQTTPEMKKETLALSNQGK